MDEVAEPVRYRVAIVEDHLLQRKRTEELLGGQSNLHVVRSVEQLPDLLAWLRVTDRDHWPHLIVLDLLVERSASVDPEVVRGLIDQGVRVLVLSALASPALVRQIIKVGVGGIVGKRDSEDAILAAVQAVLHDGRWMSEELAGIIAADATRPKLSDQEERALVLYASGLTLDAVAAAIGVKRDTARQYLDRVRAKYTAVGRPVRTKLELSRMASTDGYLDADGHPR